MFYQDAIECLQHLIHSPSINGLIEFVLKKIYSTADCMERVYTKWLTGDRAWELQVCTAAGPGTVIDVTSRMHCLTVQPYLVLFFLLTKLMSRKLATVKLTRF